MAKFRMVHTEFWNDAMTIEEMTPEDKYFFLYILTNPNTKQIGIYQITKKQMAFDMGYSMETINSLLDRFLNQHNLVKYNEKTREIAIRNWGKYNLNRGGKPMIDCVVSELREVKDLSLIDYVGESVGNAKIKELYDTSTIRGTSRPQYKEEDKEKEEYEEKEKIPYVEIINYLNNSANKNYRSSTKKTKGLIQARWNEGFRLNDFKKVIDIKVTEWINDQNMQKYIRPETLFGTKFESYLNQQSPGPTGYDPNDDAF